MKIRLLPLLFSIAAVFLLSSFTLMYPGGSPTAKTGSPGDGSNCSSCHGSAATTTAGQITSNIPASGYVPGQTYQITATNPLTGSGKFGFEVSPQNVAGTQLGTLSAGTGSKLVGGTKYVTQSSSNSSTSSWTFGWVAPAAGTGQVTFYGAFARNYSGPTTLSSLTVQEAVASTPAAAGPITGPNTVCLNNTETYSIGSISGATSYVWTAPAGATILSGQGTTSVSVSFGSSAVSGNISVFGSNTNGNGAPSNLTITVNSSPAQAGSITGNINPCQSSVQVYTVPNVAGTTYTWSVPSGSIIISGQGTNSVSVSLGGNNGNIAVVPSNNCGNGVASNIAVTVNPVPAQASNINGTTTPCQATLQTYSVTNVSGVVYTWNAPSGSIITSGQGTSSIEITVGPNNGIISVVPSNSCGNGNSTNLMLTVSPIPTQTSNISGNGNPCSTSSQTYSVLDIPGISFTWSVPSGTTINSGQGTNSIFVTVGSNNGNISVVPSNLCGTGTATNLSIAVSSAPDPTSSITGNNAPCQSSSQTYSVTNTSGVNYTWVVPTGSVITSGQGTSSINVTIGANNGTLAVTPSNTCGTGTAASYSITVGLTPATPVTPDGPALVNVQNTTTSNYTTTTVANSYVWQISPATAGSISGTTSTATVTWNNAFIGYAEIRVKGMNSCGESAWSLVKFTQVINTTGIIENEAGIKVISGGANNQLTLIMNTEASNANVMVFDLSGRILLNTTIPGIGTFQINQQLKSGVYIVAVKAGISILNQKIFIKLN